VTQKKLQEWDLEGDHRMMMKERRALGTRDYGTRKKKIFIKPNNKPILKKKYRQNPKASVKKKRIERLRRGRVEDTGAAYN